MVTIHKATSSQAEILALLGTLTYRESHGHYIEDKTDLQTYLNTAFSVSKLKEELYQKDNVFYIIYVEELPVGYAKLVLNSAHKDTDSKHSCQLERIYILQDFIPLKIGKHLLTYINKQAKDLGNTTIWLSVYIKNERAISFYKKHNYKTLGTSTFMVNGKGYENMVFSKSFN